MIRDGKNINAHIAEEYTPLEGTIGKHGDLVPYLLLAPYDERLGEAIVELVAERERTGGWLGHPKGALAYALRLGPRD